MADREQGGTRELYPTHTDEELRALARDVAEGRVFTDRHIRDAGLFASVFMPLVFMDDEYRARLEANPPGLVYEYLEKAGPRSVNGYPMFLSLRLLSQPDAVRMFDFYTEYQKRVADFAGAAHV